MPDKGKSTSGNNSVIINEYLPSISVVIIDAALPQDNAETGSAEKYASRSHNFTPRRSEDWRYMPVVTGS